MLRAPPPWACKATVGIASTCIAAAILVRPLLTDPPANRCLALSLLTVSLWMSNIMPVFATAMLVPFLAVVLSVLRDASGSVMSAKEAAHAIAHGSMIPILPILLGSFAIAFAFERHRICQSIGAKLLGKTHANVALLSLAVMLLCIGICMLMPNEASVVLVYSMVAGFLRRHAADDRRVKGVLFALMVAGNVGGMVSPISSPQNAYAFHLVQGTRLAVSWSRWVGVSIPIALATILFSWLVICLAFGLFSQSIDMSCDQDRSDPGDGSRRRNIALAAAIALVTIAGWIAEPYGESVVGSLAIVALFPVVALFGLGVLSASDFARLPWSILLQAMGAGALNCCVRSSGLAREVARHAALLSSAPSLFAQVGLLVLVIVLSSNLKSHFLSALIFSPVIVALVQDRSTGEGRTLFLLCLFACSTGMAFQMSSLVNMTVSGIEDAKGARYLGHAEVFAIGLGCTAIAYLSVFCVGYSVSRLVLQ